MKNAASLKSKTETPKTPGGISKSLLTPCRRVGLSRNWRKTVASPFNSPLASPQVEQTNETRKRKKILEDTPQKGENDSLEDENHRVTYISDENVGTPMRKVELPRRKKSKTFLNSITKTEDDCSQPELESPVASGNVEESESKDDIVECLKIVGTPVRLKSKSKSRSSLKVSVNEANKDIETKACGKDIDAKESPLGSVNTPISLSKNRNKKASPKSNSSPKDINTNSIFPTDYKVRLVENSNNMQTETTRKKINTDLNIKNTEDNITLNKDKSPNNLTKECFVVIQKKIFKKQLQENEIKEKTCDKINTVSQALFNDSDSDDVPLKNLNSEIKCDDSQKIDDDDFASQPKLKKTKSKTSLKENSIVQPKSTSKAKESKKSQKPQVTATSQSSIEDDDDFFEKKKTIIIRKTYDKVVKPLKAKSTGSITQKDIEDLKARIETKKKMLLAKSMTDTKELRELIKKWQKGCQDALMELMDLMKNKCPDQHMEYSQILQSLKIPASLVGYDSDNDCFVTPEDENIILSHIKD